MAKLKTYEVEVPIKNTMVYWVQASNKEEAKAKVAQSVDCECVDEYVGWPTDSRGYETQNKKVREVKE